MARARGSSSLRKRVLGARTAKDTDEPSAVLGSVHANAYFNAKRLKSASTGATRKRRAAAAEENEEKTPSKTSQVAFVVQSVNEAAELLRRVDAREDEWRGRADRHAWPSHEQSFPRWASQLRAGFSVLVHGVGSKLTLLQMFAETLPETDYVVHIHGELPSVTLRDVIALLQDEVYELPAADATVLSSLSFVQQCRMLVDFAFAHRDDGFPDVYVLVHSLDGPALRDPELQAGLARLAMAPTVHLVASVDSVNAPALWAEDDVQRFRWVHHRADTLRPHVREIDLRLSREGRAAEQSISGVRYILQSLTPTDVGTLRLIAQHQLGNTTTAKANDDDKSTTTNKNTATYADYAAVYAACRKQLVHATMQSLKNSIKCLQDNGLVRLLRVKNTEKLWIPLADELLQSEIIQPQTSTK